MISNNRDSEMCTESFGAELNNPRSTKKQIGRAGFDMLLDDCAAITGTACMIFWKELMEVYLEAKIILIERDKDKWVASMKVLVFRILKPIMRYILNYTDPSREWESLRSWHELGKVLVCFSTLIRW